MRNIIFTSQFKRDVKLAEKRHKDVSKLLDVFRLLASDEVLPERYKDHALGGNWKHHRDLHIEPDWLLIYRLDADDVVMVRTGTIPIFFEAQMRQSPPPGGLCSVRCGRV